MCYTVIFSYMHLKSSEIAIIDINFNQNSRNFTLYVHFHLDLFSNFKHPFNLGIMCELPLATKSRVQTILCQNIPKLKKLKKSQQYCDIFKISKEKKGYCQGKKCKNITRVDMIKIPKVRKNENSPYTINFQKDIYHTGCNPQPGGP